MIRKLLTNFTISKAESCLKIPYLASQETKNEGMAGVKCWHFSGYVSEIRERDWCNVACAISACGNFAVLGTAGGWIERFNLQSGISRGSYVDTPKGSAHDGESAAERAIRETWEEAGVEVEVISPFAQLDIPLIGQTYVIFLAKLKKPQFSPGPESSECCLFELDDIPFDSLAFSSIFVTLNLESIAAEFQIPWKKVASFAPLLVEGRDNVNKSCKMP
ncbi:hypothetical protein PVK06_034768 [Gossypium arboreum]|uniref:Nudix hydrolase domain-containing protein n=1 Tax=Gossypium arboreum TaxID=29729 RepID=A0ABR0NF31_GOSAR|nr:hypothetical protein PVK06_034768 [Gossypium arboreum]